MRILVALALLAGIAAADPPATEATQRSAALDLHKAAQVSGALVDYQRAEVAYAQFLHAYPNAAGADELHFYRGQILILKLGKPVEGADEMMIVGRMTPVGKFHSEALLAAIDAYAAAGEDHKLDAAAERYFELFNGGPDALNIIFTIAKRQLARGDYETAAKRFALIVTQYPHSQVAGPAGDLWLEALTRAKDMAAVEAAARVLLKQPAYGGPEAQRRLASIIIDAMRQRAEALVIATKFRAAAELYLQIADENPHAPRLDELLYNAGTMFARAGDPRAAETLRRVPAAAPKSKLAPLAWSSVARLDEDWDPARAADEYMRVVGSCDKCDAAADALYNAGITFIAAGERAKAATAFAIYVKTYPGRADADAVAYQLGVVAEQAGDDTRTHAAFVAYTNGAGRKRSRDAWLHAAKASARLGHTAIAEAELANARAWSRHDGDQAEADFELAELAARGIAKLAATTPARAAAIETVVKQYGAIAPDPKRLLSVEWGIAARDRAAHLYDDYARAILALPDPPGTLAQVRAAREQLDARATTASDKAATLYIAASDLAIAAGLLSPYALDARTQLARLRPNGFPPEREARTRERDEPVISPIIVLQPRP